MKPNPYREWLKQMDKAVDKFAEGQKEIEAMIAKIKEKEKDNA